MFRVELSPMSEETNIVQPPVMTQAGLLGLKLLLSRLQENAGPHFHLMLCWMCLTAKVLSIIKEH